MLGAEPAHSNLCLPFPTTWDQDVSHQPFQQRSAQKPSSSHQGITEGDILFQCQGDAKMSPMGLWITAKEDGDIMAANVDFSSISVLEDFFGWGSTRGEVQVNGRRRRQEEIIYRRRSLLSCWGRLWAPRFCPRRRRGCSVRTSSPGRSTALECLGPRPLHALCSGWWRGSKASRPKSEREKRTNRSIDDFLANSNFFFR